MPEFSLPPAAKHWATSFLKQRLRRWLVGLRSEVLLRKGPHGLVSPLYLWPWASASVRLHRHLWWRSAGFWPRALWLGMEVFLWWRWVLLHALPACWRAVRRLGPGVAAQAHIGLGVQAWRVARLALCWCIPPAESYRFKLYGQPQRALEFVFGSETLAYHGWRNQARGCKAATLALIQNKHALETLLRKEGVPHIPTLLKAPPRSSVGVLFEAARAHGPVFCKTNSGSKGQGAFSVAPKTKDGVPARAGDGAGEAAAAEPSGLTGQMLNGPALADIAALEGAWAALCQSDAVLIQPCAQNHPALAALARTGDAITVRVVSAWVAARGNPELVQVAQADGTANSPETLQCLQAKLEIPVMRNAQGHSRYLILAIDPATGRVQPSSTQHLIPPEHQALFQQAESAALQIGSLPHWPDIWAHTRRAHQAFTDVWAIAWDWVITPEGPRLLEGNTGWGLDAELFENPLLLSEGAVGL